MTPGAAGAAIACNAMRGRAVEVDVDPGAAAQRRSGSLSSVVVELPWPPKDLWPNRCRGHWGRGARARKSYRDNARLLTLLALGGRRFEPTACTVSIELSPPVARRNGTRNSSRPDQDNAVAALKAGFDGIADAIGVNDRLFRLQPPKLIAPRVLGGVVVTVTTQPQPNPQ